jgi:hypothetical protein
MSFVHTCTANVQLLFSYITQTLAACAGDGLCAAGAAGCVS